MQITYNYNMHQAWNAKPRFIEPVHIR